MRDILAWEKEVESLRRQEAELAQRRNAFAALVDQGRRFLEMLKAAPLQTVSEAAPEGKPERASESGPPAKELPFPIIQSQLIISEDTSFVTAVRGIVNGASGRLAPWEIKERIAATPLRQKLEASDKGFYNAISRLVEREEIKRHNGWLLSIQNYAAYMAAIQSGEVKDTAAVQPNRSSPMGDAILAFVNARKGVTSRDIIDHLMADAEFAAALSPHRTGAFNIIARLVRRHQILKKKGKLYPNLLLKRKEANEPLSGVTASGSDASEGSRLH